MTIRRLRMVSMLAALAALLMMPALAHARGDNARSEEQAIVEAVDRGAHTVQLGPDTYRVTSNTRMIGLLGERITLRSLRPRAGLRDSQGALVDFKARRDPSTGRWELIELRLVEGSFE